ncbi:MAG TPA: DMT family transporter [Sedimentibacter sp.]|nr:DMT family transporter [Sedimentibacter sp.]HPW99873.1 DMT family transporter [Sedimentibacter sp.]HQB63505.1 DMT family transporter [Sedimentibacter sp.]
MMQSHIGEIAALITAICWALNGIAFESAGKKIGSLSLSYIRLYIAFVLLCITAYFMRGIALPLDADLNNWIWLSLSGVIGFVLGDIFLFQAYIEIGSRISLLIMSAAPPLTALISFFILGERISALGLLGIFITMIGIGLVILSKNQVGNKVEFNRPVKGLIYASIGALGQALGLIFSKKGMGTYDPLAATQIRIIAAALVLTLLITKNKKWPEILESMKNKSAMPALVAGSIFGPFVGVAFSLLAVKYTATGIVSSISSISPILVIPASIYIFKEKVTPKEILGAVVSIAGVILLFL